MADRPLALDIDRQQLAEMCVRYHVLTLELFGSATDDRFDPSSSDLDFLVQFEPMTPREYADSYFGLLEELSARFEWPVDLVELTALRNPYFLRAIEPTRVLLHAA